MLETGARPAALVLATAAATLLSAQAWSAGAGVTIELNRLEQNGEACRAYVVLENGSALAFESLKPDLVLFDAEGIVARRIALETAPLPPGKTSLKVFDIDGLPCAGIGRILLNDVLSCSAGGEMRQDCLAIVEPASRGSVPFIK